MYVGKSLKLVMVLEIAAHLIWCLFKGCFESSSKRRDVRLRYFSSLLGPFITLEENVQSFPCVFKCNILVSLNYSTEALNISCIRRHRRRNQSGRFLRHVPC